MQALNKCRLCFPALSCCHELALSSPWVSVPSSVKRSVSSGSAALWKPWSGGGCSLSQAWGAVKGRCAPLGKAPNLRSRFPTSKVDANGSPYLVELVYRVCMH